MKISDVKFGVAAAMIVLASFGASGKASDQSFQAGDQDAIAGDAIAGKAMQLLERLGQQISETQLIGFSTSVRFSSHQTGGGAPAYDVRLSLTGEPDDMPAFGEENAARTPTAKTMVVASGLTESQVRSFMVEFGKATLNKFGATIDHRDIVTATLGDDTWHGTLLTAASDYDAGLKVARKELVQLVNTTLKAMGLDHLRSASFRFKPLTGQTRG